ncbi:MAG: DUF1501 domain-containing protein [Planctomycetaceae bacterium]|nr:DUF1501 domain-containing protein [Planctomycetaceae bacterium]
MTASSYHPCGSNEHSLGRRQFLGNFLTGAGTFAAGMSLFSHPLGAGEVSNRGKSVVVIFLAGGISQFESWDPKTDRETGGPFKSIPTSVPGIHISELLPHTAKQMHHMALVRSLSTGLDDHGLATNIIRCGRTTRSATEYPELGAAVARGLERADFPLPGHIRTMPEGVGGRSNNAAYLGPRYASVNVGAANGGIVNTQLPDGMTVAIDSRRHDWRRFVNNRHRSRVKSAEMDAYTQSYEQALRLMEQREVFDISREPAAVQAGYGTSPFSRQLLLARRLVEQEVPYIEVSHDGWDFHHNNFEFHLHYVTDIDRPFAHFVSDLSERGLLERTLVIVMTEFGRTPRINAGYGRDHYPKAWSIAMAGCGIQHGAVIGSTDAKGIEVVDRQVDHRHLFHTYLRAVGIDSSGQFDVAGRRFPIADPAYGPIEELLA